MTCDLNPSADQRQILDAAAALLDTHFPVDRLRDGDGHDRINTIADFGGFALALPEEIGGTGFTLVEEALLHVLFGRHVVSTRTLAAAVGARLAAELGDTRLAGAIATGALTPCAAVESDGGLLVFDGAEPRYAVAWAGRRLRLVDLSGLERHPVASLGLDRTLFRISPAETSVLGESAGTPLVRIADLLVSAQLLGLAEAARDLAVDYAGMREQFGRPIGAFQAIKHRCADMAVDAELLSAQLDMAAIAERDGREDAPFQTAALRRLASRVALANARHAIQIHGGIGFTDEANAHHFLKQAHILGHLGGRGSLLDLRAPLAPAERN